MRLARFVATALSAGFLIATPSAQAAPIRIEAYAARFSIDGQMQISTVATLPAGTKWTAVVIAVLDARRTKVTEWKAPAKLVSGGPITATFRENAGTYRLRISATDSARHVSTAECDVTATLTPIAGGLSVSPIATGLDGKTFAPRQQFTAEPQALARFELYGGHTGMAVSVTMELAASAESAAIAKLAPKITPTPEPDRFIITAPIDLAGLAAGRYIVRTVVGIDGQPATKFSGTFRLGKP